jgi:hypothetical protein
LITTPAGVAAVSFPGAGAVDIDVGDDGTIDDSAPTCLDPRLAMCTV